MKPAARIVALILSLPHWAFSLSTTGTKGLSFLDVVQVVPEDATNYTVKREFEVIRLTAERALAQFRKRHPDCPVRLQFDLRGASEQELYRAVERISRRPERHVVIGFSRSTLARVAARAAAPTPLLGISIGAATDTLRSLNPNFVSLSAPWRNQWRAIQADIRQQGCPRGKVAGVFSAEDVYSQHFMSGYKEAGLGKVFLAGTLKSAESLEAVAAYPCLFLGMNFSKSQKVLSALLRRKWAGKIWGTGDWFYFSDEVRKLLQTADTPRAEIIAPSSWDPDANDRARAFVREMRVLLGQDPDPVSVGTFDGVQLGLNVLCGKLTPGAVLSGKHRVPLLRNYDGVSPTGNYVSGFVMMRQGKAR